MSKYNYGFMQHNSQGETNILWLTVEADELRMASVLSRALSGSIRYWHDEPKATMLIIQHILKSLGIGWAELGVNSIDENHHTITVVDFDGCTVALHDDFSGHPEDIRDPKVTFPFMTYITRYLKS